MKIVALVDTLWVGHHPIWFKAYVRALLDQGHTVWAFCPRADEITVWAAGEGLAGPRLLVFPIQELTPSPTHDFLVRRDDHSNRIRLFGDSLGRLQRYESLLRKIPLRSSSDLIITDEVFASTAEGLAHWFLTRSLLSKAQAQTGHRPDMVFFSKVDAWMQGVLPVWFFDRLNVFPYRWSGLYFHPNHFYEKPAWRRFLPGLLEPESILRSRWCCGVGVLDESLASELQTRLGKPVVPFPDFADDSPPNDQLALAREIHSRGAGRTVVAVLGGLDHRKNILGLFDAARRLPEDEWLFVFAGSNPFDPQPMRELEAKAAGHRNCLVYPHHIEDEADFNALVEACHIVFAAYRRFPFSSNMLAKAAAFRKRVLVSKGGLLEKRVTRYRMGLAVLETEPAEIAAGLRRLTAGEPANPDYEGYRADHSIARLKTALATILATMR